MQPSDRQADQQAGTPRRATFLQTMRAVGWGLLGIRKGSGYADDASRLNPVHIVVAAVLAGVLFVTALILIVRWAVASLS